MVTRKGAERGLWPRPQSLRFGGQRFPLGRIRLSPLWPPELSSDSGYPCHEEPSQEPRRRGAHTPHLPQRAQPEIAPAGMGDKNRLPFPVLLLAALPTVLPPGAAGFTPSLDSDFTFTLPAGHKECFYQPMPLKASLEIEYQVLDGAGLDIDFHLASPEGKTLVFEQRKTDGVHTIETEVGDYMFCFDNTFSTISEKVIFFELILDNMGEQAPEEDWKKYITGTDMLEMKLEDILESINSIKSRLSKSGHIQTLLRAFEARDRNIQESNFDRVNFWSIVNLVVMVAVSAIQVYMLKSLFEDKRKSRT
ncbi:transmembrane emp24 domain-containing protein 5 [Dipodomys merriami]|uniref:transmembrane emp24 domain-containing protein 5 n=1 Tax=Dipodomys merriami TaxID=94247 RepID=UPI003855AA66